MRRPAGGILALAGLLCAAAAAQPLPAARDGAIAGRLPGAGAGDAARGRAIVASRQVGLCLLCHTGPIPEERFQGNLATDLRGAGQRWSTAQLRLRIADLQTRMFDLTSNNRELMQNLRAIAKEMGRSASTLSREVARNATRYDGFYRPSKAQVYAIVRRRRCRRRSRSRIDASPGSTTAIRQGSPRRLAPV